MTKGTITRFARAWVLAILCTSAQAQASLPKVAEFHNPLCNEKIRRLSTKEDLNIQFVGPIPYLINSRSQSANSKLDVQSKLSHELQVIPESLLPHLSTRAENEERVFRSILKTSGVPFAFHSQNSGHSYADLGMQCLILSSWIPSEAVYEARSLLLRMIHVVDDFFDAYVLTTPLSDEQIYQGPALLLGTIEPHLLSVFMNTHRSVFSLVPEYSFDFVLDGVLKTVQASMMFTDSVPKMRRHRIQQHYVRDRRLLASQFKETAELYSKMEPLYLAYSAKVLLSTFDVPFQAYWQKTFGIKDVLPLSLISELLYLPALVKQDESLELRHGETTEGEQLSLERIRKALFLVFQAIENLPLNERRFILRNYPLFRSAFSQVLRAKSLGAAYDEFEQRPRIKELVSVKSVYKEALEALREPSRSPHRRHLPRMKVLK